MVRDDVPNETQRSVVLAFMQPGQDELLEPYVEKYLAAADTLWEEKGTQRASTALEFLFPRPLASRELLDRVDPGSQDVPRQPGRQALRPRGRRRRGALPRRPGAGRGADERLPVSQPVLWTGGRYSCRVCGLAGGLGKLADAVLDAADEVAAGEGGLHAGDGEADGVVAERAAYDGAGDHLEQT